MWTILFALFASVPSALGAADGEEERAVLLRILDDERSGDRLRVRWRLRGWDGVQAYQRVEWQDSTRALFALHERDAGEAWWDFVSLHYAQQGRWGEWAIGDIQPKVAGGLLWGRGRHSSPTARWSLRESRHLGYRSAVENGVVRGVAWRQRAGAWQWLTLAGRAQFDARSDDTGRIVSLPESGRHVSPVERRGRDALSAGVGGLSLRRTIGDSHLGAVLQFVHFSRRLDLRRRGRTPWDFVGNRQMLWSADAALRSSIGEWMGELGCDADGHCAGLGQWQLRRGRRYARLLVRYYPAEFRSFFSAVPSASTAQNEIGAALVVGVRGLKAYADINRRPKRSYFLPVASTHLAWGGEGRWRVGIGRVRIVLRGVRRPAWADGALRAEYRLRGYVEAECGQWTAQSQLVHWRRRGTPVEWGRALSLRWRMQRRAWRGHIHASAFLSDSFASRLYEYEYDVPGTVTIRTLYGRGERVYALVSRRWGRANIAVRYRLQRDVRWRHYAGGLVEWTAN